MGWPDAAPEAARAGDLHAVARLLEGAGLPTAGVADSFPSGYVVVRGGEPLAAAAGLEVHGGVGLLRSVAVQAARRGGGLGRVLVADRLRFAAEQGLTAVYLLTTSALEFFRRLGFEEIARSAAPEVLRGCSEFASVCPASAVCLVKKLTSLESYAGRSSS